MAPPILPLHEKTLRRGGRVPQRLQSRGEPTPRPLSSGRNHGKSHDRKIAVPNRVRNEAIAFVAEFCGTYCFLFFAFCGTQVANAAGAAVDDTSSQYGIGQAPDASTLQYISLSFGFSLAVNVWIFFRISGGLFNPVVSLALLIIGAITPIRAALCFLAQILGAIAAAAVVSWILPGSLNVSTTLTTGFSIPRGLFLEMFLSTELTLAILFLAAEKHKATFLAPIGIGLALFVAELTGVYFTGGSLNPARSFGPAVVTGYFETYHWIYWLGPTLGALLAVAFYKLMKLADFETVNPGQDFNEHEIENFHPPADPASAKDVARPDTGAIAAEEVAQQVVSEIARSVSPEKVRGVGGSLEHLQTTDPRFSASSTLAHDAGEMQLKKTSLEGVSVQGV